VATAIIYERNEINVSMIENIFAKQKLKRRQTNVDVEYDSWRIIAVRRGFCKCYPVGVMASAHKRFTIAI